MAIIYTDATAPTPEQVSTAQDVADILNSIIPTRPSQSGQLFSSSMASFSAVSPVTLSTVIMVPSDFHAIQLTWFHRGGGGAVVGAKVSVAVTEDIGDLLNNAASSESRKFVVPIKDGVTYNENSANGWNAVTWDGSSTLNLADSGSDDFTWIKSDLIDISSIPIVGANATRFAGYRAVLVRMFAGTEAYSKGGQADWTTTSFTNEAGPNIVLGAALFNDRVTDPASWGVGTTVSIGDDKLLPCIVEAYKSDRSSHNTMIVGDSRFSAGSTEDQTREYRNLSFFLQQAAITAGNKLNTVQLAHPGMPQTTYHPRAMGYLDIGSHVESAVYLAHSINDGIPTAATIAASKTKVLLFLDKCVSKGTIPIFVTAFPLATGYTSDSIFLLDNLRQFIAGLGVRYFDPLTEYGDLNYGWLPTFGTGDSHMTDSGYKDLAENIYTLIKDSWVK